MIQPLAYTDFYKTDHRRQYPANTQSVYSNFTARSSMIDRIDKTVVFGIQYFIKEYLIKRFNDGFFNIDEKEAVFKYRRRLNNALGKDAVPLDHIKELHRRGYLPVRIKALPEGSCVPLRVPLMTIENTEEKFFWLTNFLETLLSNSLWMPMTSATIAHEFRKMLDGFAADTSDSGWFVDWQGHDFSMRGMSSMESACMSGAAHLLSFTGTDTIPAIDFLEEYYGADSDTELIGGSVPATEHSVMCLGEIDNELETFKNLITEVYPSGIVSIVSDTWDYWKVIDEFLPALKDKIKARTGNPIANKVVIRPDSGDPADIICGNIFGETVSELKGSVERLWEIFGGTVNSNGYKELDPCIGLIYGDSITYDRALDICERLKAKGFASTNLVYGIGSYTYQYNTRDIFGFAMKATHGRVSGKDREIFKAPKTDDGTKNSAKGLLHVSADFVLKEGVSRAEEQTGALQTVFENGRLKKEYTLDEIRDTLKGDK